MSLDPASTFDRQRFGRLVAAISAISAVGTSISLGLPLLSVVLVQRGVSSSEIGLNSAMAGVASLIATPFVPWLAARVGSGRLLVAAILLAAATFPLFFVFDDLRIWLLLRLSFHGSLNVAFILSEYWINASAPTSKRGLVMGIYGTMLSVGFAIGPLILSTVGSSGFTPFAMGTAILAAASLPVLLGLRGDGGGGEERSSRHFLHFLAVVPMATGAAFVMGLLETSIIGFGAVYGLKLGYSESDAALMVTAIATGNILFQLPIGLLADRMDRRWLLLLIALGGAAMAAVLPLVADRYWLLLACFALWGGIAVGLYTVGLLHLGARMQGADLASANAAFIFAYSVGMLAGPASVGAGMDAVGPNGFPLICGLYLCAFALFAFWRILGRGRTT